MLITVIQYGPVSPLGCSAPSPPPAAPALLVWRRGQRSRRAAGAVTRVRAWGVRAPLGVRDFISPCVSCRLRSSGSDPGFHPHPSSHLRPYITAGATHTGWGLVFLAPLQTAPNRERVSSAPTQCNIYKMATPTPACDFYYCFILFNFFYTALYPSVASSSCLAAQGPVSVRRCK